MEYNEVNDEQLVLFRKILNIRNYSDGTVKAYLNSIFQYVKWNNNELKIYKELLFEYVEHQSFRYFC